MLKPALKRTFERLCKQGIALTLVVAIGTAGTAEAPPAGGWEVNESAAALTGAPLVTAVLGSTAPLTNMIGQPERANLVLRCRENVLAAYISWPEVLNIDLTTFSGRPQTMVLWRVDQQPIAANFWIRDDAGNAMGMFETKPAARLIEKLIVAHQLVVRLSGRTTQDAVFDLGDIVTVAGKVGTPCGVTWRLNK